MGDRIVGLLTAHTMVSALSSIDHASSLTGEKGWPRGVATFECRGCLPADRWTQQASHNSRLNFYFILHLPLALLLPCKETLHAPAEFRRASGSVSYVPESEGLSELEAGGLYEALLAGL